MVAHSRVADKFVVRFPDGMRDKIKEEADNNNRSMNSEVIARLEESLGKSPSWIPVIGMLVEYKDKLYQIGRFVNDNGELRVTLRDFHEGRDKTVPIIDVTPFGVQRV